MSTRQLQRLATRKRVYDAALAVFRRDGVAAARTDDIATAAGISRGAFYFHFPTKEHVILERMRETEQQICDDLDALAPATPIDRVLAALNRSLAAIWEPDPDLLPDLVAVALRVTAMTMQDSQATPLRAALAARFVDAAARGELGTRLPVAILGDVYLGNTLGGMLAWHGSRAMPLVSVLDAVTDLFWSGARADARPAPETPPTPPTQAQPIETPNAVPETPIKAKGASKRRKR